MSRPILAWEGCLNSRDVGGLPVAGGGHIRWNSLIRTDNLGYLNASGIETVRAHGVSRIIDLRFPGESAAGAAEVGPHPFIDGGIYCSIPMFVPGEAELAPELLVSGTTAEIYCAIGDQHAVRIAAAVAAISTAPPGPVVVQCADGKDRTGIVVAVALSVAGVENRPIADDYAISGQRLTTRLEAILAAEPDPRNRELIERHWATDPETMLTLLEHLDRRYGGAAGYLRTHGVDESIVSALRDRLTSNV